MSIQSEIDRISGAVSSSYAAVAAKGGAVPAVWSVQDLPEAISSIPTIPSGAIIFWAGAENSIPSGWALCNGENGTPDLRNKFIVGAGGSYQYGDTGGEESVALTEAQMPYHSHFLYMTLTNDGYQKRVSMFNTAGNVGSERYAFPASSLITVKNNGGDLRVGYVGNTQSHENRPPYYALCYIMKL